MGEAFLTGFGGTARKVEYGNYIGTGSNSTVILNFSFVPKFAVLYGTKGIALGFYDSQTTTIYGTMYVPNDSSKTRTSIMIACELSNGGKTVSWDLDATANAGWYNFNYSNQTYHYWAIG